MAIPPTDPAKAAKWLKAERLKRGWSTNDIASRARGFAQQAGDPIGLTQQSISKFEQGASKRVPSWLRYVRDAFDDSDNETKEDPHLHNGLTDDSLNVKKLPTYAGMGGGGTGDGDQGYVSFSRDLIQRELRASADDLLAIEAEGNSMLPDFQGGDQILIDTRKTSLANPGAFCLWDGDGHVIKYVERIMGSDPPLLRIVSLNPIYQPQERTLDEVRIVGRVVWFGRRVQ